MKQDIIYLVAGISFFIAVSAFVLYGPTTKKKRKKGKIVGLENLGNTCFINTLLQALASSPCVIDWLKEELRLKTETLKSFPEEIYGKEPASLVSALDTTLEVINGQHQTIDDDPYSPNEFIKALAARGWIISPGEQDAHELFHVLVDTLEEELVKNKPLPRVCSLSDALDVEEDESQRSHTKPQVRLRSPTPQLSTISAQSGISSMPISKPATPFQGLLTSQLSCTACTYKSPLVYSRFDSLSLTPKQWQSLTLTRLLSNFVSSELVRDVRCTGCHKTAAAVKSTGFGRLPPCLCIHIPRTNWRQDGRAFKQQEHVVFPECLHMEQYLAVNSGFPPLYHLTAIVEHCGDVSAGHFITYRRGPGNTWLLTSDTLVRETTLESVLRASAYLLIYNRW